MVSHRMKPTISRQNLESHGIYYSAEIKHPPVILPDHVDAVRKTLLFFKDIVPEGSWQNALAEEAKDYTSDGVVPDAYRPPDSCLIPIKHYDAYVKNENSQWHAANQNLIRCEKVAQKARNLNVDSEDGWTNFWRKNTFTDVDEDARNQPGFHPVLDNWLLEGNCGWNEFHNLEPYDSGLYPRTVPKPDLTYAFLITKPSSDDSESFIKDDFVRCFSVQSLGNLRRKGIICTPTTGLRKWIRSPNNESLSTTDLACFPWAVVEFKKQVLGKGITSVERCYCQAANASAAALKLQAQLFTDVFDDTYSNLPPIISFTCVGPVVRVWLTYYTDPEVNRKRTRTMTCIWSTSVQLTWGVAALRAIIMNMHTWASRLLKPKLQAWVFHALETPQPSPIKYPNTPDVLQTLASLFNSPSNDASSSTRPSASIVAETNFLHMDQSRSRVDMSRSRFYHQPSSPSPLASSQHARGRATPRRIARAKPRFGRPFGDASLRSLSTANLSNEAVKVSRDDQVDIDQLTKSFESSHLEDKPDNNSQNHDNPGKPSILEFEDVDHGKQPYSTSSTPSVSKNVSSRPTAGRVQSLEHENFDYLNIDSRCKTESTTEGQPAQLDAGLPHSCPQTGPSVTMSQTTSSISSTTLISLKLGTFVPTKSSFPQISAPSIRPNVHLNFKDWKMHSRMLSQSSKISTPAFCFPATVPEIERCLVSASEDVLVALSDKNDEPEISDNPQSAPESGSSGPLSKENDLVGKKTTAPLYPAVWVDSACTQSQFDEETTGIEVSIKKSNVDTEHGEYAESSCDAKTIFDLLSARAREHKKLVCSTMDTKITDPSKANSSAHDSYETKTEPVPGVGLSDYGHELEDKSKDKTDRESSLDSVLSFQDILVVRFKEKKAWMSRLGSMDGHQLAQAPYLETLFKDCSPDKKNSMMREVLGSGQMPGDRYHLDEKDLLVDLLCYLNACLPRHQHISEKQFRERQASYRMKIAISSQLAQWIFPETRWCIFRTALSIRSQLACQKIFRAECFDFDGVEWAALERSALGK